MKLKLKVISSVIVSMFFAMPVSTYAQEATQERAGVPRTVPKGTTSRDQRKTPNSPAQEFRFTKMWMIGANRKSNVDGILTRGIHPVTSPQSFYNLKSLNSKRFLQYERQGATGGINIGWTDNASANTATKSSHWGFFPKSAGALNRPVTNGLRQGPIVYGEIIAIGWWPPKRRVRKDYSEFSKVDGANVPMFLTAADRNVGPNLEWDEKGASYEWVILGGVPGERVRRGEDTVILFNLKKRQGLIYSVRRNGAYLGYSDDDHNISVFASMMLKPARDILANR